MMRSSLKNLLKFGSGLITGILLLLIVPLAVLGLGLINMSAANKPGKLERWLAPWAFDRSMARRAPQVKNPFATNTTILASGLAHYRENCVVCHGAPDIPPAELAQGLNPPVPKLHTEDAQSLTDGQLFWIIKNGIRMTGMPAFGNTHSDDELWHIVAFVRHLPALTDKEKEELRAATEGEAEHHHEGAAPDRQAPRDHAPAGGIAGGPGEAPARHHDSPTTSTNHAH